MNSLEKQILQDFFPGLEIPRKLIDTTRSLVMQSQSIGALRAEEEAGRHMICAQLAIETLSKKLDLPTPTHIPSPMPPKMYANLLNVFKNSLGLHDLAGGSTIATTPSKSSPSKSPLKSPLKSPSKNALKSPSKTTPRKMAAAQSSLDTEASPSSQVKKRGGPKSGDPTSRDVEQMATGLGANDDVLEAVVYGYKKYHNLVRDRWALLCGIVYVIIGKAQPELIESPESFSRKLLALAATGKVNQEKLEEWIIWANKIVGEQSWVKRLAVDNSISAIVDPHSKRKHSSGIGNMISYTLSFDKERIEEYNKWYRGIMEEIEKR